jgi:pimeloyl-ACP methyl ester carboxylesterase
VVALTAAIMPRAARHQPPAGCDDRVVRRMRVIKPVLPTEVDKRDGLAYSLFAPADGPISGGVVILHGAGSCKESHHDFARALLPVGLASIAFDQRGHGDSDGPMDGRAIADVAAIAALLRERCSNPELAVALRGSSMGGHLALVGAEACGARAVVAICPASTAGLRRGLAAGTLRFDADVPALDALLARYDLHAVVDQLRIPVLLLHAEGDEVVPVQHSRELEPHLHGVGSRLIAMPGGHHRSIQHDQELQGVTVKFIERALRASGS